MRVITSIDLTKALREWFERQYSQPSKGNESAWDPRRLTYAMRAAAPRSDGTQVVLDASHYNEGRLDWYSFEIDPAASALATDADNPALPKTGKADLISPGRSVIQRNAKSAFLGNGKPPDQLRPARCENDRLAAARFRGVRPHLRERLVRHSLFHEREHALRNQSAR